VTHFALPAPGSTVHRTTARVLPVDTDDRVLLLHGWEPNHPGRTFWFSIGGGVEVGEDLALAATRELAEEVGIVVAPKQLGEPLGTYQNAFDWGDFHIVQTETYFAVGVDRPEVSLAGLDEIEQATIDSAAWWPPDALDADGTAASDQLTTLMRAAVRSLRA